MAVAHAHTTSTAASPWPERAAQGRGSAAVYQEQQHLLAGQVGSDALHTVASTIGAHTKHQPLDELCTPAQWNVATPANASAMIEAILP